MNYGEKAPTLWGAAKNEGKGQEGTIELITLENIISDIVREVRGSMLANKYAEGYPNKRYYGGCRYIDQAEQSAIDCAEKLLDAEYANAQPHSGSQANMTVCNALLKPGDTILGVEVDASGHLTHGSKVNFSGKIFNSISYNLSPETERLDSERVRQITLESKPKSIIAGASTYGRIIDRQKLCEITDEVSAYLMVDMAHITGLVTTEAHPSPVPAADVVTTTTHKTLHGPRGGVILSNNKKLDKKIGSVPFPGTQGGPLEYIIVAKAQTFYEDLQPEFSTYIERVVKNAQTMADEFRKSENIRVVPGGTDNYLMIVDITRTGVTGKDTQNLSDSVSIITSKESIPDDTRSPFITSGLRIGVPVMTGRGFEENDARGVAGIIVKTLDNPEDKDVLTEAKSSVKSLVDKHQIK